MYIYFSQCRRHLKFTIPGEIDRKYQKFLNYGDYLRIYIHFSQYRRHLEFAIPGENRSEVSEIVQI